MKKSKIVGYYLIITTFVIISISFIFKNIYIIGECCNIKLLPEPIWHFLDIYFYYEALPLRILNAVALLVIISILMFIFYRKNISTTTAILIGTTPIVAVIGWTSQYWILAATDWISDLIYRGEIGVVIISVVCIAHVIATGVFLIKDKDEIE